MRKCFHWMGAVFFVMTVTLRADRAWDIAEGLGQEQQKSHTRGEAYARSLYDALTREGIEAYVVRFDWGYQLDSESKGWLLVFRDSQGRYWGKQSTSIHAKWLSGKTPQQWADSFYDEHVYGPILVRVTGANDNREIVGRGVPSRNELAGR